MKDPIDPILEPPAAPAQETDLHQLLWFLDQCRARGYRAGPRIRYRDVELQVADLRQAAREGMRVPDAGDADFAHFTGGNGGDL